MSINDPNESPDPFEGLLGDLLKVVGQSGPAGSMWFDAARSLAVGVATDGAADGNPDPLERIKFEEISRAAEMHVSQLTGLEVVSHGKTPTIVPVRRGVFAQRTLDAYRPFFEDMVAAAEGAANATNPELAGSGSLDLSVHDSGGPDALEGLLGRFATTIGPLLLGMQFGSVVGHLSQSALGQFAIPVPWPPSEEILVVSENVTAFANAWSVPHDEVMLWICAREITMHTILSVPHVGDRLRELIQTGVLESVEMQNELTNRLGNKIGDPESLQSLISDPESLFGDIFYPPGRTSSAAFTAIASALVGYVDHIAASVTSSLAGSASNVIEAWRRHLVDDSNSERAAGALFGVDLGRDQIERGTAFVAGVIDRAGQDGLSRLWQSKRNLPTPADVDAPGLWLARIDLPDTGEDTLFGE